MAATIDRCDKRVAELEAKLEREVRRRDDIIIKEREMSIKRQKELADAVEAARRKGEEDVAVVEVTYEKKLAHENDYLSRMKQAYDEYVVHSRCDLDDARVAAQQRAGHVESQHNLQLEEAERQKKMLLQYVEYVNSRYGEVLENIEDSHEKERRDLQQKAVEAKRGVEKAVERSRKDTAMLQQALQKAQIEIDEKDVALMKMKSEVYEARTRAETLESALSAATDEISKCRESASRWELRAGESQQSMIELEHVRETLTSQLHLLRKELAPKEWELASTKNKLQEMGTEYNNTIVSAAERDRENVTMNGKLHLLNKQVRSLRSVNMQRERTLRRVCKVFEEYSKALQDAVFDRTKTSIITTYVPQIGLTPQEAARQQKAEAEAVAAQAQREAEAQAAQARLEEQEAALAAETTVAEGAVEEGAAFNAMAVPKKIPTPSREGAALRPVTLPSDMVTINRQKLELAAARVRVTHSTQSADLVEILCRTPSMDTALKTLSNLLKPYTLVDRPDERQVATLEEDDANEFADKEAETSRQLDQMRRTVTAATTNAETTRKAAFMQGKHAITDNRNLLAQLNDQREELVSVKREKERLAAHVNTLERLQTYRASRGHEEGRRVESLQNEDASVMSDVSSRYESNTADSYREAISRSPMGMTDELPATAAIEQGSGPEGPSVVPAGGIMGGPSQDARDKIEAIFDMNLQKIEEERGRMSTPERLVQQYANILNDSVGSAALSPGAIVRKIDPSVQSQGSGSLHQQELKKIEGIVGAIKTRPFGFRDGEQSRSRQVENQEKAKAAVERKRAVKKTLMTRDRSAPNLTGGKSKNAGPGAPGTVRLTQTTQLTPSIGLPPLTKKRG